MYDDVCICIYIYIYIIALLALDSTQRNHKSEASVLINVSSSRDKSAYRLD